MMNPLARAQRLMGLGAAALVALGLAGPSQAWATDGAVAAANAGTSTCIECHEDEAMALQSTSHGLAAFAKLSKNGCETCHGASAAHVEHPNDPKLYPKNLEKLTPAEGAALCRDCHEGGKQMHWPGSPHAKNAVGCTDCHSVHAFKSDRGQLKEPTEPETCFVCHKQVRTEVRKTSHHPIREGEMTCSDCHNTHGTPTDKLITAASVNEQCYSCHAEKRGPFLWEHAPVRESCLNCHTPHGSQHQKLQRAAVPYLCQQCHSNTRHPGTLYDALTLPGEARQSNREFNRGCVNCHASIHGSNHPSGPYLGR